MRWQLILPFILAAFFVSCSKSAGHINPNDFKPKLIDSVYSNYPAQMFNPNAVYDSKFDIDSFTNNKKEKIIILKILEEAKEWRYTPYKLGGTSSSKGGDCSAFTGAIFKKIFNIKLERSTKLQQKQGKLVSRKKLKAGDLVFFRTDGPYGLHVGIYLENRNFIHLSSKGGTRIQSLDVAYWSKRYITARRFDSVK